MSDRRSSEEIETWFRERLERHDRREHDVWVEYLETTRRCETATYEQAEPLAWRRLRRNLAELAHDRRRDQFERDRALAEDDGFRLAG